MTPFLLTLASVTIPAALAALAGYHLGRANGRVVLAPIAPDAVRLPSSQWAPVNDTQADAESRAYMRGVHDERARHRAARSAAGTKAAATRRNRVTNEERPRVSTTVDAATVRAPFTLSGDGDE